jgi:hypothetical protein
MAGQTATQSAGVSQQLLVTVALNSWKQTMERADKAFASLTEEQLQKEVAPGKNRVLYLLGHLTAVHDRMLPLLGLGQQLHSGLGSIFIDNPDRATAELPSGEQLKAYWKEVNTRLLAGFNEISPEQWLQRHNSVSEEDFAKEPTRNRLAVLLSRTTHLAYHLGQIVLALT